MRIGIVAHEARIAKAYNLFHEVQADYIRVDSTTDGLGCEGNHRAVWASTAAMADEGEWVVILEDDALPVPSFRAEASAALAVAPADVVSFYMGKLRPGHWQAFMGQAVAQANSDNACWILSDTTLHAVAIALRGPDLVDMMLNRTSTMTRPIDERITMWCRQFGHATAYSHPSLVDHADETPCITTRFDGAEREPGRVAWQVGTRPHWSSAAVKLKA